MGISGGSTSRSGSGQKWAQPIAQNTANEATSVYNANKPSQQAITDQVQSLIPGLVNKYQAGDPNVTAATNYGSNVLGGQYLGGNPFATTNGNISTWNGFQANPNINPNGFLDSIINTTNQDVKNNVASGFGSRGSFGGTAYINALTRGLASNESGLRYNDANNVRQMQVDDFNRLQAAQAADNAQVRDLQANDFNTARGLNANNYAQERANQQQVAGMAPQLAAADYLGVTPLLSTAQLGAALPYTGLQSLADVQAAMFNGGTQKQSNGIGGLLQGAGSVMSGAAALSDRRLKTNITKLGEFADGLGHYAWTYIWGEPATGVMADEVERLRPWALGPRINGFATVNYGAL